MQKYRRQVTTSTTYTNSSVASVGIRDASDSDWLDSDGSGDEFEDISIEFGGRLDTCLLHPLLCCISGGSLAVLFTLLQWEENVLRFNQVAKSRARDIQDETETEYEVIRKHSFNIVCVLVMFCATFHGLRAAMRTGLFASQTQISSKQSQRLRVWKFSLVAAFFGASVWLLARWYWNSEFSLMRFSASAGVCLAMTPLVVLVLHPIALILRFVYVLQWASAFAEEEIAVIQQAIGDRSADWQTDVHARCVHLVAELLPSLSVLSPGMMAIWISSLIQAFMWYATILKGRHDHMIGMLLHVSVSFAVIWPATVVSMKCRGVLDSLNMLRRSGDEAVHIRVHCLEAFLKHLNYGQGPGFNVCGIVISCRLLGVVGVQVLANLAAVYALARTFAEIGGSSDPKEQLGCHCQ